MGFTISSAFGQAVSKKMINNGFVQKYDKKVECWISIAANSRVECIGQNLNQRDCKNHSVISMGIFSGVRDFDFGEKVINTYIIGF